MVQQVLLVFSQQTTKNVITASQQSGSATFANVQDFNWNARRSTLPKV